MGINKNDLFFSCSIIWFRKNFWLGGGLFVDEVGGGSKEPAKRQRRWNTEILRTAEPQNSSIALSENLVQTNLVKPILGRTDSTVSEDAPKERLGEYLFYW